MADRREIRSRGRGSAAIELLAIVTILTLLMPAVGKKQRDWTKAIAETTRPIELAASPATIQREERRLAVIEWPDTRYATVQHAIDALPDGGTLRFSDGVFTLDEPLFVRGKRIVIEGAGCNELPRRLRKPEQGGTHLVGPRVDRVVDFSAARGLINFESAGPETTVGGGTIRGLKLSGFDAGIRAAAGEEAAGGGAVVEDVCIADTGRGIAWSLGASLSVKNVLIRDVSWNGASIAVTTVLAGAFIHFAGVTVVNAANACVFYHNAQAVIVGGLFNFCGQSGTIAALNSNLVIADTNIIGSAGPGIAISGGSAFISETFLNEATGFGVLLHHVVHGDIEDVHIKNTTAFSTGPQAGSYGDGVTVVGGTANGMTWVTDSFIENSSHSGVANYGAFVSVGDVSIQCTLFDVEGEVHEGKNFSYTDLGGLKCGCPTANGTCQAVTGSGVQAPGPLIQIP